MIRGLGGGATQFSIAGGDPQADVSQVDFGVFAQDDWRLRQNLTLSMGLRYETQSNINSNLNFAPRVSLGWSPRSSGSSAPVVVLRAGFGIFYDRFSEIYTLQARRYDGVTQQTFIVSDPEVLNLFPYVPTVDALTAFAVPQTIRRVSDEIQTPYTMQSSFSVERRLPFNSALAVTLTNTRTVHALRSRNVNAPRPGSGIAVIDGGNVFDFESSGVFNQRQLAIHVSNNFSSKLYYFATYLLGRASSDTDGAKSFPANSYDLRAEYGRAAYDVRHQGYFGATYSSPLGIMISPYLTVHSGMPFDITTGRDRNSDSLFTDRPSFATDLSRSGVLVTPFGTFDPTPLPGQAIIPRNYGQGPGFVSMNIFVSKTFGLGEMFSSQSSNSASGARKPSDLPYRITLSVLAHNLLNHTNLGTPIGNLGSPLFGLSNWNVGDHGFGAGNPAGNRRIELQIRFSF